MRDKSLGASMTDLMKPAVASALQSLRRKLNSLGFHDEDELRCLLDIVKLQRSMPQGEDIVGVGDPPRHLTVLLAGVACLYKTMESGERLIYAFYHPGDFCDLHRYVWSERAAETAVGTLTDCSIATIEYRDLDEAMERHRRLARVIWQATMLEASVLREGLTNLTQRPVLQRVSHLLC